MNCIPGRRRHGISPGWVLAGCVLVTLSIGGAGKADGGTDRDGEPWVAIRDGALVYRTTARGDRIPDFSAAGYGFGTHAIPGAAGAPAVPIAITLTPASGDRTSAIQRAIDDVSQRPLNDHNLRGAVLLKAGEYEVAGQLQIHASGVVLMGEGIAPKTGTRLRSTTRSRTPLIDISGTGPAGSYSKPVEPQVIGKQLQIADEYVPVGATSLRLISTEGLQVGSPVIVRRFANDRWIAAIGMDKAHGIRRPWEPQKFSFSWERIITAVQGNQISLNAPITNAIEKEFGGGAIFRYAYDGRIENVGVTNLDASSESTGEKDHDHAEGICAFNGVVDGWVTQVNIRGFAGNAIAIQPTSRSITVQDVLIENTSLAEGGPPSGIMCAGDMLLARRVQFVNCYHAVCFNGPSAHGPSVVVDCRQTGRSTYSGPHMHWATGGLFDNCDFNHSIELTNATNSGSTSHGWMGANFVLWNCRLKSAGVVMQPTAQSWAIGVISRGVKGNGYVQSENQSVVLKSLYEAQVRAAHNPDGRF